MNGSQAPGDDAQQGRTDSSETKRRERELAVAIEKRCRLREIPVETEDAGFGLIITVEISCGRDTRRIYLSGEDRLKEFLSIPFEDYVALKELLAICSYETGEVESYIEVAGRVFPVQLLARRLGADPNAIPDQLLELSRDGVEVALGKPSPALRALGGGVGRNALALRIRGTSLSQHDAAVNLLERIANSLFFEIDANLGIPMVLSRVRTRSTGPRVRASDAKEISFPRSEYEPEPMALYWYGRGAAGMPLLQFLAFYQVLEFYFPLYAEQEVRRRVRGVVKHPEFNPHSEPHISGIMKAMRVGGNRGFGDERAQLRATVRGCANPDALREHLEVGDRAAYFERKKTGPADTVLKLGMADDELLDATAERVYEIRCKIVHTKEADAMRGQLLPFSPEAEQLGPDIHLLEGLARSALVAAGRELNMVG